MPAGSGHGFVFAFPEGKAARIAPGQDDGRAAHRADAILARECSFLTLLVYDEARRSRISRSAERDQGSAFGIRDFLKKIE